MRTTINIGIIGFGTVGSGVYNLIKENFETIAIRSGVELKVRAICDLELSHVRENAPDVFVTESWSDITSDPDIDIVAELIGGTEPALSIIKDALRKGKNVVTANKKLLAERGAEIFETVVETGNSIGFEAAVGGGIPCILTLKKGMVGNQIRSIVGILNGTTNYILTRMAEDALTFADSLKNAQTLGFAEADPTFDIEGVDAGHKIAILAMLSYGRSIPFELVPIEGIKNISPIDISYAKDVGYVIKLLGIAKLINGKLDIRVHPTMIPKGHPLASIRDEFNSVLFEGDMTGPVILNGKGAGSLPTASSVISDIVQLSSKRDYPGKFIGKAEVMAPEDRISRYYIRLYTEDSPGILSQISGVLGRNNISIASVIQKEVDEKFVPLIIVTHEARESDMLKCIDEIQSFSFVKERIVFIRVEDFKKGMK
ncbi:MAG TPA: homoserine dehydrogenase [Spirochaetota bacterium]|jgi:homoserine dehydrogenase|nr:homoserine dehydrogenase [Spirochaetota bacterium]HOK02978.1 homoserine dehydrogenase [Spirochaetota bacterium]HOK93335.1 homoserine dehydrogenase [Spirochaetota bacterium]HON16921.1 homoserine dehydrogenase [Spirochaetota bacterium]HOQ11475.1 homoserine dehydrogenase [Spirochaetota bacterium]